MRWGRGAGGCGVFLHSFLLTRAVSQSEGTASFEISCA